MMSVKVKGQNMVRETISVEWPDIVSRNQYWSEQPISIKWIDIGQTDQYWSTISVSQTDNGSLNQKQ
jgi:hypothetical protein